jgi:hypothetical protein
VSSLGHMAPTTDELISLLGRCPRLTNVHLSGFKAKANCGDSQHSSAQLRFMAVFEAEGFPLIEGLLAHIHIPSEAPLFTQVLSEQNRRGRILRLSANEVSLGHARESKESFRLRLSDRSGQVGTVTAVRLSKAIDMASVAALELHDSRYTAEALVPDRWREVLSGMHSLASIVVYS